MKLYEVNAAISDIIDSMVDEETGEIVTGSDEVMEEFEKLLWNKQQILEYLAKMVLNTRADAAALKEEENRLKARRDRMEKKAGRIMEILDRECGGVKTNLGVATLNYRKTSRLEVADDKETVKWLVANGYDNCYRIKDPEVAKTEVKKLIGSGVEVPGCTIIEDRSCSLK